MRETRRSLLTGFFATAIPFIFPWTRISLASSASDPSGLKNGVWFFTINNDIAKHPNGHKIGGENSVCFVDSKNQLLKKILVPMQAPHSMIRSKTQPDVAVIAPRETPLAIAINLRSGQVIKKIELKNGDYFYGHGFFHPDGKSIFLTGATATGKGFLREFDSAFNVVGEIDSFGESPHDCALVEDGRTLVVANTAWGSRDDYALKKSSSLSYIDFKTRKLVDQEKLPLGYVAFQHLQCLNSGDVIVACDDYSKDLLKTGGSSLLAYKKRNEPLRFLECPLQYRIRMAGNTLSVKWDTVSQMVLTTTPGGPVTVWSLKEMKAVRQDLIGKHPHGVALTPGGDFLVTTANEGLWQVNAAGLPSDRFKMSSRPNLSNISAHSSWGNI